MIIRRGRVADADAIAALHERSRAAYYGDALEAENAQLDRRPMWRRLLQESDTHVFCAAEDDSLVGFLCLRWQADGTEVELHSLYVDPARFGTGIADALYEQFVAQSGDRQAHLEVWNRNERAEAFYRRHGWIPSDRIRPGPSGTAFVTWRRGA
ncbi:GNAT family N-acetyltransferase [Microbacterium testaceum]|uniref:GNAT family N-acetyltransferase n=1 Tax=Microbacterium testaceum TaxID=2033 RepID=UPI00382070A5